MIYLLTHPTTKHKVLIVKTTSDLPYDHNQTLNSTTGGYIVNSKLYADISIIPNHIAPYMIYIRKDKHHILEALEDNTVAYCIHALRNNDGSGDIMDPDMIPVVPPNGETYQHGSEGLLSPLDSIMRDKPRIMKVST